LVRSLSCMSATEPRYCPISTLHRKLRQGTGSKGRARAAVTRRLCTIAGFYKYTVEEELLERSPAAHVRRPRVDYESHAAALDRNELGALLVAAGLGPPTEHALLALNGLRSPRPPGPTSSTSTWNAAAGLSRLPARAARSSPSRSRRAPPGRSTWSSASAPVFLAADGAAAGPARHLHRRRLRRRRRPVTGAPAGKAPPDDLNRRTELPAATDPRTPGGDAPRSQREREPPCLSGRPSTPHPTASGHACHVVLAHGARRLRRWPSEHRPPGSVRLGSDRTTPLAGL
jgi:hypothetical protein